MQDSESKPRQSIFSVARSVGASMFGVQSSAKHEEDFAHGSVVAYVVVGLVATLVFIMAVWGLVKFAVSLTGAS
jgi:flagellar biogenesis protein FliO